MDAATELPAALWQRLGPKGALLRRDFEQHGGRRGVCRKVVVGFKRALMRLGPPALTTGLKCFGLYGYGRRQFRSLRVNRHDCVLPRLPRAFDRFTLLHLSDLHLDLEPALVEVIAAAVRELDYDLCVMTGDFRNLVSGPCERAVRETLRLRERLRGDCYAVLGNHDLLAMVPPLEAGGVRFLLNESVRLERDGAALNLAGIDDAAIRDDQVLGWALRQVPADEVCVLLSHAPAVHPHAAGREIDLVLAGHTHGGQICLPGGWILWRNDPSPRRLLHGPWRLGETRGYTSAGTGACGIPIRLNSPPEITLHCLRCDGIDRHTDPRRVL
jgi:predicted MPP superfamily phosphohydrolase